MDKELVKLDPRKIQKNPDNPRIIFREEEMDALFRSIEAVGIQVPLSVFKKKGTKDYVLIDGERRWRCAKKLGFDEVPAIIEPEPTPLENLLMMFNIHHVRVQWDLIAIADKIEKVKHLVKKERGVELSKSGIADLTGVPESTITRCEQILALPKKYQDLIWSEIEKPKGEQKYTEDLFLEIRKSIKVIENYTPEVMEDFSSDNLLDRFFRKYKNEVVKNRVAFRDISRIARGEKVGIKKPVILKALRKFITDSDYSIESAFRDSVEDAYSERTFERSVESLIAMMQELENGTLEQEARKLLINLKKEINRILDGN